MRQYLQLNKHVIAWDAANAFNTIDRHAVLQQVAALFFPDLLREKKNSNDGAEIFMERLREMESPRHPR
jgi:hypothetical protein